MKKNMKLFLVLAAIMMCLSLTACGRMTEVELSQYLSVSYTGYNGNGTARFDFDYADFEYGIMSEWKEEEKTWEKLGELTALEMTINCVPASIEGLSNGDTVTVTITADEEKAKELGYSFSGMSRSFTVEGLSDAVMIDPFDESVIQIGVEGTSPFASVTMNYVGSRTAPEAYITYIADDQYDLANGDTITVTATMSERYTEQGYLLTRNEMTFTVEGLRSYITDVSMLNADDVFAIFQKVSEYFESQKAKSREIHTKDGGAYYVYPEMIGSYGALRFADSGYAVVEHGWGTTAVVLIPFYVDVQDVSFGWWNNEYYEEPLLKNFADMAGYFVVSDLLLDENDKLIKEGVFGIQMSDFFESEQQMLDHIMDRYNQESMVKGTFAD